MKRAWRLALLFSTVTFFLGGIGYACPAWAEQMGLDFWNLPTLQDELDAEVVRDRVLARESESVLRSVSLRCALTRDLVEDRVTLEEAVTQFQALNEAEPGRVQSVQSFFPAPTVEESTCRQVLSYAEARAAQSPNAAAVLDRLRQQADAFRQRRLPRSAHAAS